MGSNFLAKVVTQALLFSGVTAFCSLSANLESRLKPPSEKNYPPFLNDAENNSFTSVRIDDLSELKTLGRCYLSKMYAGFMPSSYILLELAVETIIGTNLLSAYFSLVFI